jgi:hypothetical protein
MGRHAHVTVQRGNGYTERNDGYDTPVNWTEHSDRGFYSIREYIACYARGTNRGPHLLEISRSVNFFKLLGASDGTGLPRTS